MSLETAKKTLLFDRPLITGSTHQELNGEEQKTVRKL